MPSRGYMLWLEFEITLHLYLSISKSIKLSFTKTHDSAAWFSNSDGVVAVKLKPVFDYFFYPFLKYHVSDPVPGKRSGSRYIKQKKQPQHFWDRYARCAVAAFRSHGCCFHRDLLSMLPLPLAAWLMRGGQRGDFLDERMQRLWYKYLSNIRQSQIMQKKSRIQHLSTLSESITMLLATISRIIQRYPGNVHPLLLIARGAAPCAIAWYYDGPLAGSVWKIDMGSKQPRISLWYSSIAMTCYGKWRNMIISRDTSSN